MAMIKCMEWGKEISDRATSCPSCGCPVGFGNPTTNNAQYPLSVDCHVNKLDD